MQADAGAVDSDAALCGHTAGHPRVIADREAPREAARAARADERRPAGHRDE